jgi:PAS domain S-box-containing protein
MQRSQKVNILLVDDQPTKLVTYEVILASLDENLVKATSGSEALRLLLQQDFAVVLMDVCMPDLDGFELARMIREHPRLEKTAILLVSAVFMTEVDRLKGYESGAVDYIQVPIIPEILRAKVRVFTDLYRTTEQLRTLNAELEHRVLLRTADLETTAASMRKSEERFRFLAEAIPSMVWIASIDGTITYANQRWLDYRGLAALPPGCQWPNIEVHPDDRARWLGEWRGHLERNEGFEIEARHERHDGTHRWFLTRAAPRRTESGEIVCWFGVTTDIHEQKELQDRLRDADRRKDEFLAVLSHELRNPLAPIRSAVELLRMCESSDPNLAWSRQVIDRQTSHLTRLVDDLLDVSRITTRKVRLEKEPVDVTAVLADAIETNRALLDARSHAVAVEFPEGPAWVDGDAMRLGQVFSNLINNAAKYTECGGRITIRVEIEAKAGADLAEVLVRVADTGPGIPASMLPVVFDLFTQGSRTIDQAQGGLGVGLALVRSLVQLHGGSVEALSDGAGFGSEFVVRLPATARRAHASPPPVPAAPRPAAPRTVLVVDDNADAADGLAMVLRAMGHVVNIAGDGVAALEVAERHRPEVVLLDIGLPRLNGCDVAKAIRRQPWGKRMILIAQTGWGQEEDRRRTAEAGFDVHLTKPVDVEFLLTLLGDLTRAQAARAAAQDAETARASGHGIGSS